MYFCDFIVNFDFNFYDNIFKIIFGYVGNWGYDDVYEFIFMLCLQEVVNYICSKFYCFYVYEVFDLVIVEGMV